MKNNELLTSLDILSIEFLVENYSLRIKDAFVYRFFKTWFIANGYVKIGSWFQELYEQQLKMSCDISDFLLKNNVWFYEFQNLKIEFPEEITTSDIFDALLKVNSNQYDIWKENIESVRQTKDVLTEQFLLEHFNMNWSVYHSMIQRITNVWYNSKNIEDVSRIIQEYGSYKF